MYDAPYPAHSAVVLVVCVANTVYMYDAPPPYPGIDPSLQSPVYPAAGGAGAQVNGAHYPANAAAAADGSPQSAAAGISLTVHYTTQLMLLLLTTAHNLQPQVYHSLCITLHYIQHL